MRLNRFAKYAWGVVAYNILVILWGAFVRATGSGAGCGSHWPKCNGEIVPRAAEIETMIEFTHRLTSGVALLLVVGLLVWALRARTSLGEHVVRGAWMSMVFIIIEALVGAGLVIFGLVADNSSSLRALVISIHLINTFLLVAWLTLTAWWASGCLPMRFRGQGVVGWLLGSALIGTLLLGATGAITALGDTLFPVNSLAEGIRRDFASTSHILEQLRIVHPVFAVLLGIYLVVMASFVSAKRAGTATHRLARALMGLFVVQLFAGGINVVLLAPTWMQLVHLLLADFVWIVLVLLTASALAQPATEAVPAPAPAALATGATQNA